MENLHASNRKCLWNHYKVRFNDSIFYEQYRRFEFLLDFPFNGLTERILDKKSSERQAPVCWLQLLSAKDSN